MSLGLNIEPNRKQSNHWATFVYTAISWFAQRQSQIPEIQKFRDDHPYQAQRGRKNHGQPVDSSTWPACMSSVFPTARVDRANKMFKRLGGGNPNLQESVSLFCPSLILDLPFPDDERDLVDWAAPRITSRLTVSIIQAVRTCSKQLTCTSRFIVLPLVRMHQGMPCNHVVTRPYTHEQKQKYKHKHTSERTNEQTNTNTSTTSVADLIFSVPRTAKSKEPHRRGAGVGGEGYPNSKHSGQKVGVPTQVFGGFCCLVFFSLSFLGRGVGTQGFR